jgi:DNA-binding CsgD family transcriptional regulator
MDRLQHSHARRLLDFVAEAETASLSKASEVRELILAGLMKLIPCDVAICVEGPGPRLGWTATDTSVAEARDGDLWLSCCTQLPSLTYWDRTRDGLAIRFSDHVSQRAYRRSPVYQHFFRPFGLAYVVSARVSLPTGQLVDFGCEAERHDFSDPELALLEGLRPYLAGILHRAESGTLPAQLRAAFALTRREAEMLALLARGKSNAAIGAILFIAPGTVSKHLEHLYAKLGVTTRTEAAIRALEACQTPSNWPELPTQLLNPNLETVGIRPKPSASAHLADLFGLTPREADVLKAASSGRSNAQIAATLGIAQGTVKNHLERVYAKLEVKNRTEASARIVALDLANAAPAETPSSGAPSHSASPHP